MIKQSITVAVASAVLFLSGCATVGTDFKAPASVADAGYRHAPQGADAAARLPQQWWSVFGDATLDRLEGQALADSPTVKAAAQRLLQAEAQVGVTRANERPQLNVSTGVSNSRTSANTSQGIALGHRAISGNNYSVGTAFS